MRGLGRVHERALRPAGLAPQMWLALLLLGSCGEMKMAPVVESDSAAPSSPVDSAGPLEPGPLDCPVGEEACPDGCADTASDPLNCGGCGIVCIVPQGEGSCEAGVCGVGTCETGWGDCDGLEDNGCETETACGSEVDSSCTTSCDSLGTLDCGDVCAPTCQPPAETCDHSDEDCDGTCDNGALVGCRQAIHRTNGSLGHMYGPDLDAQLAEGQAVETADYFYLYSGEQPGTRALYRCDKGGGRTFLTTSSSCEGQTLQETIGYIATDASCGGTPLYRLYSSSASDHLYTLSASEADSAVASSGYRLESTVGYVYTTP